MKITELEIIHGTYVDLEEYKILSKNQLKTTDSKLNIAKIKFYINTCIRIAFHFVIFSIFATECLSLLQIQTHFN